MAIMHRTTLRNEKSVLNKRVQRNKAEKLRINGDKEVEAFKKSGWCES